MTDFVAEVKKSIKEEENDQQKYLKLAENAPEKYAPIIRDIAAEEESHRKHLHEILEDCGCGSESVEESATESNGTVSEKKSHREVE